MHLESADESNPQGSTLWPGFRALNSPKSPVSAKSPPGRQLKAVMGRQRGPRVVDIEKSLGWPYPRGISCAKGKNLPSLLRELDDRIDEIKDKYVLSKTLNVAELRCSPQLEADVNDLFAEFGARVWPDGPDRSDAAWLVDADKNTLGNLYTKNLFYSDREDRETLSERFSLLVKEKCIRFLGNERTKVRKRTTQNPDEPGEMAVDAPSDSGDLSSAPSDSEEHRWLREGDSDGAKKRSREDSRASSGAQQTPLYAAQAFTPLHPYGLGRPGSEVDGNHTTRQDVNGDSAPRETPDDEDERASQRELRASAKKRGRASTSALPEDGQSKKSRTSSQVHIKRYRGGRKWSLVVTLKLTPEKLVAATSDSPSAWTPPKLNDAAAGAEEELRGQTIAVRERPAAPQSVKVEDEAERPEAPVQQAPIDDLRPQPAGTRSSDGGLELEFAIVNPQAPPKEPKKTVAPAKSPKASQPVGQRPEPATAPPGPPPPPHPPFRQQEMQHQFLLAQHKPAVRPPPGFVPTNGSPPQPPPHFLAGWRPAETPQPPASPSLNQQQQQPPPPPPIIQQFQAGLPTPQHPGHQAPQQPQQHHPQHQQPLNPHFAPPFPHGHPGLQQPNGTSPFATPQPPPATSPFTSNPNPSQRSPSNFHAALPTPPPPMTSTPSATPNLLHHTPQSPQQGPRDILSRTKLRVDFGIAGKKPAIATLRGCYTCEQFFNQLDNLRPRRMKVEGRLVQEIDIEVVGASSGLGGDAGVLAGLECCMQREFGDAAFEGLVEELREIGGRDAGVRVELRVVVDGSV